ncbi:MAG: ATP-grasp domain-containing protein [Myxococcaceae bacterium]|nr:ATP-grasp domain-containing protein [Myxococcaceae bacterium]
MNVVFLSPHFPPNFWLFARALHEQGARVLGVGDVPSEALAPELRPHLADYVQAPLTDRDQTLRSLGLLVHRHGRLGRIESLNEHWLPLEAALREDFNVPGPRPAQVALWQDKLATYRLFRDAGVPTPQTEAVVSQEQVEAFASRVGYPLVCKPAVGVGASGAFSLRSAEEVRARLTTLPERAVVQPFIDGRIVTFDGVVDREGEVAFSFSLEYSHGVMEVIRDGLDISFWTHRQVSPGLAQLGTSALKALGLKERWFHLELFRLAGGRYMVLEANLRPPGGFIPDMMNYAVDDDVARAWARVVVKGESPGFPEPKFHVGHVARRTRAYRRTPEELAAQLGDRLLVRRALPALFAAGMGDEMYLVRTRTLAELRETTELIQAR